MMELQNNDKLYSQIKLLLDNARDHLMRNINMIMVTTYFKIGKLIVENEQNGKIRAKYGAKILKNLSLKLTEDFGKGFSQRNLKYMRRFYLYYSIGQTVSAQLNNIPQEGNFQLSWSHYILLINLPVKERTFYETEAIQNNWSLRELKRQINSALFERIILSKDKKDLIDENMQKYHLPENPKDVIKDPYVLDFLGLEENSKYSETDMEEAIINKLEYFLLELGKGFSFVGRQQRFTFDEEHFFVDLVFYNRLLQCFVLIDLKIGKLQHQDMGQMLMYVNYFDRFVKNNQENPTIGILLCKSKSDNLVKITLPENSNIFASKYKLYLPTKEELRKQLEL